MTNTPMTFENAFPKPKKCTNYHEQQKLYSEWHSRKEGWLASQAQQEAVIAELKEDLLDLRKQVNYRCADVQRLTEINVELVEALEALNQATHDSDDACYGTLSATFVRKICVDALAKVKGK